MTLDQAVRDEVVDLEERFWLEGGGDPGFWRRHFADDGLVALPFGIMDKDQTVAAMGQGRQWTHVRMDDLHVVDLTASSVLVSYRATATRAGDDEDHAAIVSSVYVDRNGTWKLSFHQQCFPTAPPP